MSKFSLFAAATSLVAGGLAAPAWAVTTEVGPGSVNGLTSAGGCLATVLDPAATACFGIVDGNNVGNPGVVANVANFLSLTWGVVDTSPVTVNSPADFNAAGSGYMLDLGAAYSGDFVVGLKQADGFSLYFYNDAAATQFVSFDVDSGFDGNQGPGNGISHFTVYSDGVVPGIPEPHTYALMLAGLGILGFVTRRRRPR
jgi:hypothetical protein